MVRAFTVGGVIIDSRDVVVACIDGDRGRANHWGSGRGGMGAAVGNPLLVYEYRGRNS